MQPELDYVLVYGVHVCPPGPDRGVAQSAVSCDDGNGLVRNRLAHDGVDELDFDLAQRGLEQHTIVAIDAGGQADDEGVLELEAGRLSATDRDRSVFGAGCTPKLAYQRRRASCLSAG